MKSGYQQGNESMWWWKVAKHLDETQLALVNAIARNADDPMLLHALEDTVRQAQATLLEIFHMKGLLQAVPNVPQQSMPGGSPWPQQFQQPPGSGNGSPGAWAPQFPQPPQGAGSGNGSPGAWAPQFQQAPQFPQPPPSFPQQGSQMPSPPSPQQGSQMPSPPLWIPDFSQMSSIPPPPHEPPPQESSIAVAPPETTVADDPRSEATPIVPESSQPVGPEAEADHPVS
jgi:hypothetical protein